MLESQLGPLIHNGTSGTSTPLESAFWTFVSTVDDVSFAIVLELQEDKVPLASQNKAGPEYTIRIPFRH
jgi:hypothetical protein